MTKTGYYNLQILLLEPIDLSDNTSVRQFQSIVPDILADAGLLTGEYCMREPDHTILQIADIMLASQAECIPKSVFMDWVSRLYDAHAGGEA